MSFFLEGYETWGRVGQEPLGLLGGRILKLVLS